MNPTGRSRWESFAAESLRRNSWICDIDSDNDNDIVMVTADAEAPTGWVKIFFNADGQGGSWTEQTVASSKGDLHSLAVADFDNDGDLDIFSGEGPLGGTGAGGAKQTFIWENKNELGGRWQEHVVSSGYRCHEAVAGDVDNDGDIDVCFKPWRGDTHIFLKNTLDPRQNGG